MSLSITLRASIGIASTDDPDMTGQQLLDDADQAMYRAKRR